MRVLYWSASFPPNLGGLEVISGEYVNALRQRGVELTVVTNGTGPDQWCGVPVHRFRLLDMTVESHFFQVAEVRSRIRRIIREFQPDLVHVNGIGGSLPMLLLCVPPELPSVVTLHGTWGNHRPREISRLFWNAGWVAACSAHTLEVARRFEPGLSPISSVILNALPEPPTSGPSVPGDYLLCSGRLSFEKGFDVAIRALASLPKIRLRIAGDGDEKARLEALCREIGVQSRVDFLGILDRTELAREMGGALALLCPSRVEGFGLVALEAAQAGTPVIAARVDGLPEVVAHGEGGVLVSSHGPQEWAAAIRALLNSPDREEMGQHARRRAARLFSWEEYVESYLRLYRQVLDGGPRPDFLQARYRSWAQPAPPRSKALFRIAGATVRIRSQRAELLRAWSNWWASDSAAAGEPDLTIDVSFIEEPTTGYVDAPDVPRRWRHMGLATDLESPILACQRPGVASFYHRANRHLVVRIDPGVKLLPSDLGKPLMLPLLRWLADREVRVFHAAVVSRHGQGVLLVGEENAGKSTVLLACLRAGWEFVADDLVLVREDGWVEGLYPSTWLTREHAEQLFPDVVARLHSSPLDPKSLLFVDDIPALRLTRTRITAAVLVNRGEDAASQLVRYPREPLLRAVLPGSLFWNAGLMEEDALCLVGSASTWKLQVGGDLSALPALLAQLLER